MATASQGDLTLTGSWQDVITTYSGAASVDVMIQNIGPGEIGVFFGGSSAPTGKHGVRLAQRDSVKGNAAHIWVRGDTTGGTATVTLL